MPRFVLRREFASWQPDHFAKSHFFLTSNPNIRCTLDRLHVSRLLNPPRARLDDLRWFHCDRIGQAT
jgi:hypothetical protein